ncbi:MAG TPA: acyl carrier protein [Ktedonobacteraceae bacterium]
MKHYDTSNTVAAQVAQLICQYTGSADTLTPEMDLLNDLAIDSIELVELGLAMEKTFQARLPMAEVRRCLTVGELTQLVEQATLEMQVPSA